MTPEGEGRLAQPPILVIMGVSGSGKSTVARPLAARLGWTFQEGDALHPAANIAKMKAGVALDDADRAPWLAAICAWIDGQIAAGAPSVITCSALKRAYRDQLRAGRPQVGLVYLRGSEALIAGRVAARVGHFMPASLLDSQFADLEEPDVDENPVVIDIDQPVEAQVSDIVVALGLEAAAS
jgi:carbohydrate kinase (thermoresistant glucokinase family)